MSFFVFVLGLVFGSFVNVLVYRIPRSLSIGGRSVCPECKKQIAWYDNIPLLSYILLKGKCRMCGDKISLRYPLIELSTGLLFLVVYIFFLNCSLDGSYFCSLTESIGSFSLPYFLFVNVILVSIFVIDLKHKIIPENLNFVLYLSLLLVILFARNIYVYEYLFSGFLISFLLYLLHLITKGKGMGLGDVKFALFAGTLFGLPLSLLWLFVASLTGSVVGLILIVMGKTEFGKKIPFGPYLIFSLYVVLFWGESMFRLMGL